MEKIFVIADDFTGAAEIVGVGLRHGLAGVIVREEGATATGRTEPLIVVDTDSRLLPSEQAAQRVRQALAAFTATNYGLLYKKIDSVLRGPVVAEVDAALAATGRASAIVVAANPVRGRTIEGGHYFVEGVPLHQTEFAADPHDPARTSRVVERVGSAAHVYCAPVDAPIGPGIAIGEVRTPADVQAWAARVTPACIAAGGADFFAALLPRAGHVPHEEVAGDPGERVQLLVCGTHSAASRRALQQAAAGGAPVRAMPDAIFADAATGAAGLYVWRDAILRDLRDRGRALVAVGHELDQARAPWVVDRMSESIALVVQELSEACELYVEGGATASHLARRLGWREFHGARELAPGVVRLAIAGQSSRWMTIKPGSYAWPAEIWQRLT